MTSITSGSWWKAATMRALRTAAVVAIPYVPVSLSGQDYLIMASAAGMGFVLSILTSMVGIPEIDGDSQPWYFALLSRVVKTVAQALLAAVGTATFFYEVDWSAIPALVIAAAIGSALLFFTRGAPEADKPVDVAKIEYAILEELSTTGDSHGR